MDIDIFAEGKELISASRAAEKTGYTSDYIGQLCRAKKIPGKLIGRTWYIELASLLNHKKSKQIPQKEARTLSLEGNQLKYEKDDRPLLPELLKSSSVVKNSSLARRIDAYQLVRRSVATLTLILILGTSLIVSKGITPTLPNLSLRTHSAELATVSLFNLLSDSVEFFINSFNKLRHVAFNTPSRSNTASPAISIPASSVTQAISGTSQTLSVDNLRNDIRSELEQYVRTQISLISEPRVVYNTTAPVINTTVLREQILLADTRPTVTRQSTADVDVLSRTITRALENASFTSSTLSGGSLDDFTFINATGTNLYLSGRASTSELRANTAYFGGNVGIGTTDPLYMLDVRKDQAGATSIRVNNATDGVGSQSTFTAQNAGGAQSVMAITSTSYGSYGAIGGDNAYWYSNGPLVLMADHGSTGVIKFATGGNSEKARFDVNGRLGIGTTTPIAKLSVKGEGLTTGVNFQTTNSSDSPLFSILDSGNIGIGTMNPLIKLDVRGGIQITGSNQFVFGGSAVVLQRFQMLFGDGNQNDLTYRTFRDHIFETDTGDNTAGTTRLVIKGSTGNVGIGTTTPSHMLTISSPTAPQLMLTDGVAGSRPFTLRQIGSTLYIATSSQTSFATSSTPQLTINGTTGYVGIGTANPTTAFEVGSTGTSNLGRIRLNDSTDNQQLIFANAGTDRFTIKQLGSGLQFIGNNQGTARFYKFTLSDTIQNGDNTNRSFSIDTNFNSAANKFYGFVVDVTNNSSAVNSAIADFRIAGNSKVLIDVSGNVGIGTTSPSHMLTISSSTAPQLMLTDGVAGSNPFVLRQIGSTLYIATSSQSTFATSTITALTISGTTGNLGIGQNNPQQMLTVAGSVAFQGIGTGAGSGTLCYAGGTGLVSTSTTGCTGSSLRYKDNVEDMNYGLSDVLKIRPVSYDYKPEMFIPGHQIGFVAEEMYEVIPEVVGLKDGQPDNIDYGKLTSLLIKAMQEIAQITGTFKNTLVSWLGSAENGIVKLFAKEVHTDTLCIKKLDGSDVCVTGDQLSALLMQNGGSSYQPPVTEESPSTTPEEGGEELDNTNSDESIVPEEPPQEPETSSEESSATNEESESTSTSTETPQEIQP